MRLYQRSYASIYISFGLFLLLCGKVNGQASLDITSHSGKIAFGLEENYFGFVNFHVVDHLSVSVKMSLYTEALAQQLFYTSAQWSRTYKWLYLQPRVAIGGKFSDGVSFALVSSDFMVFKQDDISLEISPMVIITDNKLRFQVQSGGVVNIYKSSIFYYMKFGPPVYAMYKRNNITAGLMLKDNKIRVMAGFQVPTEFDFKYSRIVTSFIYCIN